MKRAGLGAAAVWAAPLVASSSAYGSVDRKAQTICRRQNNKGAGGACGDACTVGVFYCNSDQTCGCGFTITGCCSCVALDSTFSCGSKPCNKAADCPAGFACLQAYCCNNGAKGICVTVCPNPGAGAVGSAAVVGSVRLH